jgi:glucose-6-phosphate dehydrogenase assembly protein OpcA
MAMLCSVTVSMGEERRGVLREMRLVTGESRVTSLAEKPELRSKHADNGAHAHSAAHTNVTRENQEVVVGQTAVVLGIEESLDVDAIALGVLALDNVKGVLVVKDLLLVKNRNLSGHFGGVSCVV